MDQLRNPRTLISVVETVTPWRLDPVNYSSWTRLTRVQAWVNRFLINCRSQTEQRSFGNLLSEEIHDAANQIIVVAQKKTFPDEWKSLIVGIGVPHHSKILGLQPRLDYDGLMRCDGRLTNAEFLSPNTGLCRLLGDLSSRSHNQLTNVICINPRRYEHISGYDT